MGKNKFMEKCWGLVERAKISTEYQKQLDAKLFAATEKERAKLASDIQTATEYDQIRKALETYHAKIFEIGIGISLTEFEWLQKEVDELNDPETSEVIRKMRIAIIEMRGN